MKRTVHILMMPDFRSANPYQTLLADAVEKHGASVAFSTHRPGLFPFIRTARHQSPRPDVLHLHWLLPFWRGQTVLARVLYTAIMIADLIAVRMLGIRVVWTVHNLVNHESRFPGLELILYRRVARLAHRIIVHSNWARREVGRLYRIPARRLTVIPIGDYRGVHGQRMNRAEARRRLNLPQDARVFVHLGLLRPYKGTDDLLAAWKRHHTQFPSSILVIGGKTGDEAYGKRLRTLSEKAGGVTFIDRHLDDEELTLHLSAADAMILPFRRILTSSSILLAISFALPVIAPRLGPIQEELAGADDLIYLPEELEKTLAKAESVDLCELGERTEALCGKHGWDAIGRRTVQVYESGKRTERLEKVARASRP